MYLYVIKMKIAIIQMIRKQVMKHKVQMRYFISVIQKINFLPFSFKMAFSIAAL
jgi:hypothetical protein